MLIMIKFYAQSLVFKGKKQSIIFNGNKENLISFKWRKKGIFKARDFTLLLQSVSQRWKFPPDMGEYMSHSSCFHRHILAYLAFIFAIVGMGINTGCGYKADPFYKPSNQVDTSSSVNAAQNQKKKVLFEEIDSKPTASYEADEE